MKSKTPLLAAIIVALAVTGIARAGTATNSGPNKFHYVAQTGLTNKHAATNGVGSLRLDYYDQGGKSLVQKFDLTVSNLSSLQLYSLFAALGDDPAQVEVSTFTSDKRGKVRLSFLDVLNANGTPGPTNKPMPALLNPLLAVHWIGIIRDQTQTVAYAWLDTASLFQYQAKRNLTRVDPFATAAGSIDLRGNGAGANLKLKADGLMPLSQYYLALNSNIVNTAMSDAQGRLQMIGWPIGVTVGPSLRLLELLDNTSNAVLTTTLSN